VKVPKENIILGLGQGLKLALITLNIGRLTVPAACTAMAKNRCHRARLVQQARAVGQAIGSMRPCREDIDDGRRRSRWTRDVADLGLVDSGGTIFGLSRDGQTLLH